MLQRKKSAQSTQKSLTNLLILHLLHILAISHPYCVPIADSIGIRNVLLRSMLHLVEWTSLLSGPVKRQWTKTYQWHHGFTFPMAINGHQWPLKGPRPGRPRSPLRESSEASFCRVVKSQNSQLKGKGYATRLRDR